MPANLTPTDAALLDRWAGALARLAEGPTEYGPHDVEALAATTERMVVENARLVKELADLALRLRVAKMDRTAVPGWEPNAHGGWLCMGGEVPRLTSVNPVPDSSPLRWWIVDPHDFRLDYEREADGDPTYDDALDAINAAIMAAKEPTNDR